MRVFAGPNGSGKTTIINAIRDYKVKGVNVDFGIYINADDIAGELRENKFSFNKFVETTNKEFQAIALASGLVNVDFGEDIFRKSYQFKNNSILLKSEEADERLAQIIADFLRKKLLQEKKKFSFETVFSHYSKLDIMKQAVEQGYKVYLYFVSTESPEINKYRVSVRKQQGGHDVDEAKIESRYYRSLDLLFEGAQLAYQTYFFDNSEAGKDFKLVAHFKKEKGEKKWDKIKIKNIPNWFINYYSAKVKG